MCSTKLSTPPLHRYFLTKGSDDLNAFLTASWKQSISMVQEMKARYKQKLLQYEMDKQDLWQKNKQLKDRVKDLERTLAYEKKRYKDEVSELYEVIKMKERTDG